MTRAGSGSATLDPPAAGPRATAAVAPGGGPGARWLGRGRTRFLVWAPRAVDVDVELYEPVAHGPGDERPERRERLAPVGRGYHAAVVDGLAPGRLYRYRLDGGRPLADPASAWQPHGVPGPSAIVDPAFDWTDEGWRGIRLRDLVLYEIHVGTFTPEGTFDAVIPRLDALADLGITALELMPIAQFPGRRNWGYDGVFPYAAHDGYGGPAGLRRLVDACHARGLGVVLDVVHNHIGPEGGVLGRYGPYFTDRYATPWGPAINVDGRGSAEVRRFFVESALHWIRDFHVDGLRLDAVHAIVDRSAVPFLEELGRAVHAEGDRLGRRTPVIAESDANDPRLVDRLEDGGLGLDAVWADDFHHALHALLTGERRGYYADFDHIECLEIAYAEGFVYAGQPSAWRGRPHGRSSRHVPARRFVVCAQNHDQVGNRARADRLGEIVDAESRKLAAAAVILSPFVPLLFMGEEYGESAPFPYFVDHRDPALARAVRVGREAELAGLGWEEEVPDPAAPATFAAARIDWEGRSDAERAPLLALYGQLLELRRELPPLRHLGKDLGKDLAVASSADDGTLVVRRWTRGGGSDEGEGAVGETAMVLHFGTEPAIVDVALPAGTWRRLLDTAAADWGGPGGAVPGTVRSEDGRARLPLGARSALLLGR